MAAVLAFARADELDRIDLEALGRHLYSLLSTVTTVASK